MVSMLTKCFINKTFHCRLSFFAIDTVDLTLVLSTCYTITHVMFYDVEKQYKEFRPFMQKVSLGLIGLKRTETVYRLNE